MSGIGGIGKKLAGLGAKLTGKGEKENRANKKLEAKKQHVPSEKKPKVVTSKTYQRDLSSSGDSSGHLWDDLSEAGEKPASASSSSSLSEKAKRGEKTTPPVSPRRPAPNFGAHRGQRQSAALPAQTTDESTPVSPRGERSIFMGEKREKKET